MVGELVAAMFERVLIGFLPMCVSKCEILVTPCGVMRKVLIVSATSEANLYGVFAGSILITPRRRLNVCIILSTAPMAL